MLFMEALEQLKEGATMRRTAWPMEEGYLKLLPGMKFVWKIVLLPNPNAGNFIFSVEDFLGSDWEKFECPSEPVAVDAKDDVVIQGPAEAA